MTIFHKNENCRRINAKINRILKKIYSNIPANLESNWCRLYWVIAKTKIDNLHTHTHIHTFSADDFFFNVDHIYTKEKLKFDNWFLTPIQGFTQSKIEKANKKHNWIDIKTSFIDLIFFENFKSPYLDSKTS